MGKPHYLFPEGGYHHGKPPVALFILCIQAGCDNLRLIYYYRANPVLERQTAAVE